jgi:pimeloyl-ACP methyl ester carboxylesterase
VVLVHAASGSAESWPYQQPFLAHAGYRVIAYSRRGHFNSSSFDEEHAPVGAEDLGAVVNHLGIQKFHLVSAALGGYYATDYALLHPERLLSFVVISSPMAFQDPEYLALTGRLWPPEFKAMPTYFKEISPTYRTINPEGLTSWREIADRARLADSSYYHRVATEITWSGLATLSPRTLLVTGTSDLYMPPPVLRVIADHIGDCSLMLFPEVGHFANWESPSAFNAVLLRFLKGARITE